MAVFMILILIIVGIVLLWRQSAVPAAPQSVTYVTVEADKRKQGGISTPYGGFNFAW